jgi:arylformamidase
MKKVLLSYMLDSETPLYGDTPKVQVTKIKSMGNGDSSDGYLISAANHSGTHVDAPGHFIKDGKGISKYSIQELEFHGPKIIETYKEPGEWVEIKDIEKEDLDGVDCILFKTNFSRFRGEAEYRMENPGISPETIEVIRRKYKQIRCLGIDSISVSGFKDRERGRKAHKMAFKKEPGLGAPLLLIEDMDLTNVSKKSTMGILIVVPWAIKGIDSAPCTVMVEMESDK